MMGYTGHVACTGERRSAYVLLVKPEGNRPKGDLDVG